MKRAIWIVAALVLLFTSVAPPATWATPTRDVYDVPNPENSAPGDDDDPLKTVQAQQPSTPVSVPSRLPVDSNRSSEALVPVQNPFWKSIATRAWILLSSIAGRRVQ